jgi:hypothetical protein
MATIYERALSYLKECFDFKNSPFTTFICLSSQEEVTFDQLVACFKKLEVVNNCMKSLQHCGALILKSLFKNSQNGLKISGRF